jgi:hypothetical protein
MPTDPVVFDRDEPHCNAHQLLLIVPRILLVLITKPNTRFFDLHVRREIVHTAQRLNRSIFASSPPFSRSAVLLSAPCCLLLPALYTTAAAHPNTRTAAERSRQHGLRADLRWYVAIDSLHQWCISAAAAACLAVCLLHNSICRRCCCCCCLLRAATGYTASQLFGQGVSYTYDDVIMHPGHISFGAHEVRQQPAALAAVAGCGRPCSIAAC